MDLQIAKHQPMMSKQPDLGGWLGRQSRLTYNTFCFVLIDVTKGIGFYFSFDVHPSRWLERGDVM